ncbi:MAG: LTA synthase family protein [Alistipes sp.]
MRTGFCFTRMYANGMRSIQAMPAILGSIPSFRQPFVLMPQSLGRSRQLPPHPRGQGLLDRVFLRLRARLDGLRGLCAPAGVERLLSREDYEARHGKGDFDGFWGIWDGPFLQFAGEELDAMPEPFFASLFTLSAHHPFGVPDAIRDSLPEGFTKIQRPAAYDDLAFRRFFERFGDREWFRRTIFVFVADHVSSEKWAPETRTFPGNYHIVGFIYTPDGALRGQCPQIVQQIDLMPTLLGLLEVREPYFAYGRDVLNEPDRAPWAVMYDTEYRAMDDRAILSFDGERLTGLTMRGGVVSPSVGDPAPGEDADRIAAQNTIRPPTPAPRPPPCGHASRRHRRHRQRRPPSRPPQTRCRAVAGPSSSYYGHRAEKLHRGGATRAIRFNPVRLPTSRPSNPIPAERHRQLRPGIRQHVLLGVQIPQRLGRAGGFLLIRFQIDGRTHRLHATCGPGRFSHLIPCARTPTPTASGSSSASGRKRSQPAPSG